MSSNLIAIANPDSRKNWIISVEIAGPDTVRLSLVPDKLIAEHKSLKNHIRMIMEQDWSSPEAMILKIIEDVNNELVPKWLEVTYEHDGVKVKIDDRQPGLSDFNSPAG